MTNTRKMPRVEGSVVKAGPGIVYVEPPEEGYQGDYGENEFDVAVDELSVAKGKIEELEEELDRKRHIEKLERE